MMKTINLTYLFPDICNLHGDRGNVWALEKVGSELGLDIRVSRVDDFDSTINFDTTDVFLISPGELTHLLAVMRTLDAQRSELMKYLESGKYFIVFGTTGAIFAKKIIRDDNTEFDGLGIIDGVARELRQPYGDDILFTSGINGITHKVCGSQIQMIDLLLNEDARQLGKVTYGYGNDKGFGEGYKENNFIFSNCLGPMFAKNPWIAESILRDIAEKKSILIDPSLRCDFSIQERSYEEIEKFTLSKETEMRRNI